MTSQYDLKAAKDPEGKVKVPILCSKRWLLAYIGFLGFFFIYSLRVNMSVAIVCMVKDDSDNSTDDNTTSSCADNTKKEPGDNQGEFDWDKSTQGFILSSFFYGYMVTQIPGGWLASRFGGKKVLGTGVLITAVATLLVPVAARWDYRMVLALRVIMGLAEGVSFPSMHAMWGRWSPMPERTKLTSFTYTGLNLGNIITYIVSGVLCAYGFDNGWASIFYVTGGGAFVWVVLWFFLVSDTPEQHPTISEAERNYIITSRGDGQSKKFKVPWLSLVKSRALWVCLAAHLANNWMHYTLLTGLPTFMKEVLKFDIEENGVLSAVPYMVMVFTMLIAGYLADFLRARYLSTTVTRRLFQSISLLGSGGCLVAVGFISCEDRDIAVVLLAVAVGFEGLCYAGYMVNQVDFAPRYAGVLFGITNFIATIPGMLAPTVIGALTPNKTQEEWRRVFFICAGLCLFGVIIFGGFASGELEPWAVEEVDEKVAVNSSSKEKEHGSHSNAAFSTGDGDIPEKDGEILKSQ